MEKSFRGNRSITPFEKYARVYSDTHEYFDFDPLPMETPTGNSEAASCHQFTQLSPTGKTHSDRLINGGYDCRVYEALTHRREWSLVQGLRTSRRARHRWPTSISCSLIAQQISPLPIQRGHVEGQPQHSQAAL